MSNTSKVILGAVVVLVIIGAIVVAMKKDKNTETTTNNTSSSETSNQPSDNNNAEESDAEAVTVTYTADGFSPASVNVKAGGKITFVNKSDSEIRPSSNPHPVHTDNPELNADDIQPGGSQTLTLTTTGTWGVHNHYSSSHKATIVVQ